MRYKIKFLPYFYCGTKHLSKSKQPTLQRHICKKDKVDLRRILLHQHCSPLAFTGYSKTCFLKLSSGGLSKQRLTAWQNFPTTCNSMQIFSALTIFFELETLILFSVDF